MLFAEKYRPSVLEDFGLDPSMVDILRHFLKSDTFHLLFVGNTGSGKTSLMRILVETYYAPYKQYQHNLMYVNTLKDQGFSDFCNEIQNFCQSKSLLRDRKKIVILDDIDLIVKQNQHVFRNIIDNYGKHVQFLMVCGNLQRVVDSLQSRSFILKLPDVSMDHRRILVQRICANERIRLSPDAAEYVVKLSNNIAGSSVRNVINFMEKIYLIHGEGAEVGLKECQQICSSIPVDKFEQFFEACRPKTTDSLNRGLVEATAILHEIYDYGFSVIDILDYIYMFVKNTDMLSDEEKYKTIRVLCTYISIYYNVHEHPLELALFAGDVIGCLQ